MKLDFESNPAVRSGQLARMLLAARRAVEEDQEEAGEIVVLGNRGDSGSRLYLQVLQEVVEEAEKEPELLTYLVSALASHAFLLLRWSASYLPYALEATEDSDDAEDFPAQPEGEIAMLEYLATVDDGRGLIF